MVHCQKKQAEHTVMCTDSKDDLSCTVSVHSCSPSGIYQALCLFCHALHQLSTLHCLSTHAVHQLSFLDCVFSFVLSISCLPFAVSVHSCLPSAVYHGQWLFANTVLQLSTLLCVSSLMLSISSPPCRVSCCGVYSLIHNS